ncbi:hypothetical protein CR513_35000 [Mucuna pruriens]|uniref:RRM domain-containing protein n=1 Tax=Mucuna pruriens TaxID=157652 RepID=A0A371G115_MUCPR|nr:hypothetical protein CR513_35000 [Mucuna pruriens]
MGTKAKKAMKKNMKRATANKPSEGADFLPLEGGPPRKLAVQKPPENTATVLYVGRIPHGFYEKEMEGYFGQFGTIKRLRIARNKKTGKPRHFGFIEFESPEVAKIVADTMHNYLLFEHLLQVHVIPTEHVHPRLWRGFNYRYKPLDSVQIERKHHDKSDSQYNVLFLDVFIPQERTLEEHKKLVEKIMKHDQKRRKRIEAAGIEYECPEIMRQRKPADTMSRGFTRDCCFSKYAPKKMISDNYNSCIL